MEKEGTKNRLTEKMPEKPSNVLTEEEEKNKENEYVCGETNKTKNPSCTKRQIFLLTQNRKKKKKKEKPTKIRRVKGRRRGMKQS